MVEMGPGLKDAEVVIWMGDFNYRCVFRIMRNEVKTCVVTFRATPLESKLLLSRVQVSTLPWIESRLIVTPYFSPLTLHTASFHTLSPPTWLSRVQQSYEAAVEAACSGRAVDLLPDDQLRQEAAKGLIFLGMVGGN